MIARRSFLTGLASMLAAPAVVHAGNLMPVRSIARFAGPVTLYVDPAMLDAVSRPPNAFRTVAEAFEFVKVRRIANPVIQLAEGGHYAPNYSFNIADGNIVFHEFRDMSGLRIPCMRTDA